MLLSAKATCAPRGARPSLVNISEQKAAPLAPAVLVSPELVGGACPAVGSAEEAEAVGEMSDMDVEGCGSSKAATAVGEGGGAGGPSPRPAPAASWAVWNTFSLLASASRKGAQSRPGRHWEAFLEAPAARTRRGPCRELTYQRSLASCSACHSKPRRGTPHLRTRTQSEGWRPERAARAPSSAPHPRPCTATSSSLAIRTL